MSIETLLKSDYSNPAAENLLHDLEKKGLRVIARSGNLVVKPKKAIPAEARPLIQKHKSGLLKLVKKQPISAERISIIRQLYRPPGIAAMELLLAINPRKGTYLGLPRVSVTPREDLRFFAEGLDKAFSDQETLQHICKSRESRKELILLSATLIPKEWLIQVKKNLLLIHPPNQIELIEEALSRRFKQEFSRRMISSKKY